MDFLTFVLFYLICSIVFFGIIALIIYLILRKKAIAISKNNEELLEKVLERL